MAAVWPTLKFLDATSGKGAGIVGGTTLGHALFDRDHLIFGKRTTYAYGLVSETASVATQKVTKQVRIPVGVNSNDRFNLEIRARKTGGGNGSVKIRNETDAVDGATVTVSGATFAWYTARLNLVTGWGTNFKELALYLWTDGTGTIEVDGRGIFGNLSVEEYV